MSTVQDDATTQEQPAEPSRVGVDAGVRLRDIAGELRRIAGFLREGEEPDVAALEIEESNLTRS